MGTASTTVVGDMHDRTWKEESGLTADKRNRHQPVGAKVAGSESASPSELEREA